MASHKSGRAASEIPSARVVKHADEAGWRTQTLRKRVEHAFEPLIPSLRTAAVYVTGLFPLISVVALAVALLWAAGLRGSP